MRILICFFTALIPILSIAETMKHSDSALEMQSFKVEYYDTSKTGIIKPLDCSQCATNVYNFKANLKVKKNGKPVKLEYFLTDYWNATGGTIFISPNTNDVIRINY